MDAIITDRELLKRHSAEASAEECKKLDIFNRLKTAMEPHPNALGLSAMQIGVLIRAFLIRIPNPKDMRKSVFMTFINPEIMSMEQPCVFRKEGCLSFKGLFANTHRFRKVVVKDDVNGLMTFVNTMAVVIQHECGHLDGKIFLDEKTVPFVKKEKRPKPNDACPCGAINPVTGKVVKFKKCHMKGVRS